MKVTLNESTAEKITALTTDNISAETVIDMAVDSFTWVKSSLDEGKVVMAARQNETGEGWIEEEFYPGAEIMNALYSPNAAEDAAE